MYKKLELAKRKLSVLTEERLKIEEMIEKQKLIIEEEQKRIIEKLTDSE